MIVIEHCGNVQPGQKCSAVFFSHEDIQREKAFYARFCSGNGVTDQVEIDAMVAAHVPNDPYWLVSLKPSEDSSGKDANAVRFHKVDDRSGQVVPDPV